MIINGQRAMAYVAKINKLEKHPNADALDICTIGGWKVVSQKDLHREGDLVIYCSIDSWIPHTLAPFLSGSSGPKEYEGVQGNRLRTVKLRKQVSQGLVLPIRELDVDLSAANEGDDVSELLGILKWEAPIPTQLAGQVKGNFPDFIPKTDQERVQNLQRELEIWYEKDYSWEITEKLDGSSMTVFSRDGEMNVCSRNLNLECNPDNAFWKAALDQDLGSIWKEHEFSNDYVLQGELIGEGVQGNPYGLSGRRFVLYDIYDTQECLYLMPFERREMFETMVAMGVDIDHVPVVVYEGVSVKSIDYWLDCADGETRLKKGGKREGIVMKCNEAELSFKAISNKWLLKNGG